MSDKKEEKKEKKPIGIIRKVQIVVACVFAFFLLMSMVRLSNSPGAATTNHSTTPNVEASSTAQQPKGPQFDVWMESNDQGVKEHVTSKEYYTGSFDGTKWTLTMRGSVPNGHIDNMFSWNTETGQGLWKAEYHPKNGVGQRANGSTEVTSAGDGTFTLLLLDSSGKEYSRGRIVPVT